MEKAETLLKEVCGFLNGEGIDYVVVGGFAVLFHGYPRTTMDIDFVMRLEEEEIPGLIEFLRDEGFFADEEDLRAALSEGSHCSILDRETMFRLDVKGVYTEMDRRTLRNGEVLEHDGVEIRIASPEDTIANKLVFGRERDWEDALGIHARQKGELDEEYLEEVCEELGVTDELERLRAAAEKYG